MRFKNTKLFSCVALGMDLPFDEDYYHKGFDGVTDADILEGVYDEAWWNKQYDRCINGYWVDDAIEKGGDFIVDGKDCFWQGNDCYIPAYDLHIKNKRVHISGRMYFYLNFWWVYGIPLGSKKAVKQICRPRFLDMDFFFWRRIEMMEKFSKNGQELKSRQKGFSEKLACLLGYNYTFVPGSQNIVVAGKEDDALHTFSNTTRGLERLKHTQFYKEHSRSSESFRKSKYTESWIRALTAKDNEQTVSRFCLAEGSKVLMYNGKLKKVEDITVGDKLMGKDSTPRNVLELDSGIDDLYKVSSRISKPFKCNSNHLLYCHHKPVVRNNDGNKIKYVTNLFTDKDVKRIDDEHFLIEAEKYYNKSKTFKKHCTLVKSDAINFKKRKVYIDPYFLGLWLGDGDKDAIRISTADEEVVEYLEYLAFSNCLFLNKSEMINPINGEPNKASRYSISGTQTKKGFRNNNLIRNGFKHYNLLKNKYIPDDYIYNTIDVRMQLLAGLIDSDGWKSKNGYGFAQVDNKLTEQIIFICESLGFRVNRKKRNNNSINDYKSKDINYLYIYGYNIEKIPVKVKRKKQTKYIYRSKFPNRARFEVEKAGKGKYYGFRLDGDHLFLLEDFVITHNTPYWVIHEEIGKGKKGWSLGVEEFVRPSQEAEGVKTGYQLFCGTGSSMDEGAYDLEQRYINPSKYDILEFDNIWEDEHTRVFGKTCHITPAYAYKIIDEDGNSLKEESLKHIKETGDAIKDAKKRYTYYINNPIYGSQIFAVSGGGYFGETVVERCNNTIAKLQVNIKERTIERLCKVVFHNAEKKWLGAKLVDDPNGYVKVYEMPMTIKSKGGEVIVPEDMYYTGIDSYDLDVAKESDSKGAMLVKKGFDEVVALLFIRPELYEGGADKFYEMTAGITVAYNALTLIESRNKRILDYYNKNGLNSFLKVRPDLIVSQYVLNSKTSNIFGIDPAFMPTMLKILGDKLEQEGYIEGIKSIDVLRAYAKFRYDPQRKKYNCDITSASAILETLLKDEEILISSPVNIEEYSKQEKYGSYDIDRATGRFIKY